MADTTWIQVITTTDSIAEAEKISRALVEKNWLPVFSSLDP